MAEPDDAYADELGGVGPNDKPIVLEPTDLPGPRCKAELCERPTTAGSLMCGDHWAMVDPAVQQAIVDTGCDEQTPGHDRAQAYHEGCWRAICAVARTEGVPYRRHLFDGTLLDSLGPVVDTEAR